MDLIIMLIAGVIVGFGLAAMFAGNSYHEGYEDGRRDQQYTQMLRDQGIIE